MAPKRLAACSCGQLSIEVAGEPLGVGVCHCLSCQRRTGSTFAALAVFAAPYKVTGQASSFVRRGDAGSRFTFRFCPKCGSNLYHTESDAGTDAVSISVGCFADPDFPQPTVSVYDCRRHSWVKLPDGVRRFDKDPPET